METIIRSLSLINNIFYKKNIYKKILSNIPTRNILINLLIN
jgi:hypothetical protein